MVIVAKEQASNRRLKHLYEYEYEPPPLPESQRNKLQIED